MAELTKNFATSLVATAPSPATSGTSLVVTSGEGTRFPAVPFNATIAPASGVPTPVNAEIVRVTAVATDTLTITRAQETSTARTVVVGDRIWAGVTVKTLVDLEALSALLTNLHEADTSVHGVANTTDLIADTLVDAKGDLIAATANDAVDNLAVGTNGMVLRADSAETTGLEWGWSPADRDNAQAGIYAPGGVPAGNTASTALTASRAYFARFVPSRNMTIISIAFLVGTAAGADDACDVGLFSWSGTTLTRLVSKGATTGLLNSTGVKNATFTGQALTAGTAYYAGFSVGTFGGTAASILMSVSTAGGFDLFGTALGAGEVFLKASAHPLGATVTTPSATNATPLLAVREA